MLNVLLVLLSVTSHASQPVTPPTPKPRKYNCYMYKSEGKHSVKCGDKTEVPIDPAATTTITPPVQVAAQSYIKDVSGVEFKNLKFLQIFGTWSPVLLNRTNGHVLSYDNLGNLTKIDTTYFSGDNCTGTSYIFSSDIVLKNHVFLAGTGYPLGSAAIVTNFAGSVANMRSTYADGVCSVYVMTLARPVVVEPVTLDSSDPQTISLPIEVAE